MKEDQNPSIKQTGKTNEGKPLSNPLYVASLEKGFRILEAFRLGSSEMGLTEIARMTGLDKSAAQRYTNTLCELGYLQKNEKSKRYRASIRLLDFSYTCLKNNRLTQTATPHLIEAGAVYGTTVNFCELIDTDLIYTIRNPNDHAGYKRTIPGRRVPAFLAAGGVSILAYKLWSDVLAFLDASDFRPVTEHTIYDRDEVTKRIKTAKTNGYDIGVSQQIMNEISVAAPVFDGLGNSIAAVQVSLFMPEWSVDQAREKIVPLVTGTARIITESYTEDT